MTTEKIEAQDPTAEGTDRAAVKKEPAAKAVLRQLIGLGLAGGLLWFCFKDADFNKLWLYTQAADYRFIVAVCFTSLLSHLVRAWRWVVLLQPLSEKKIGLWNSFCAVMYGYAVNLVIPRGGEVARLVSISKTENIPWAGVLPTMFIDRLLDIAMLVLLLGLSLSRLPKGILNESLTGPLGIMMCLATLAGLVALPFVDKIGSKVIEMEAIKARLPEGLRGKLEKLLRQFGDGTKSLTSVSKLLLIAISSILIWTLYWLNMYLMVWAFHFENEVDLSKTLIVFTISAVGVLAPTPGNIGSYHLLTSQALQKLGGIDEAQSLAYAAVTHLITFIFVSCLPAAICFVIQNARSSKSQKAK